MSAESAPDRLLVLGGPQVLEVVEPVAAEFDLPVAAHDKVRDAVHEGGLALEGIAAAVVDVATRLYDPDDEWVNTLIDRLWRIPETPKATLLLARPSALSHFTLKYGFRKEPGERWAAAPWPTEAEVVRGWLSGVMQEHIA